MAKEVSEQNTAAVEKKDRARKPYSKKPAVKPASPGSSELHIGSSQEAIRAIEELPLPQNASAQNASVSPSIATFKTPAVAPIKKVPAAPIKPQRAELPYVSDDEEPAILASKPNIVPRPKTSPPQKTSGNKAEPEDNQDEDDVSAGSLAPAPLRGFPRFPNPVQKSPVPRGELLLDDEAEAPQVAPNFPQSAPGSDSAIAGNDGAQMRVGGILAQGAVLQSGKPLKLEISARNTGTSWWLSDDETPIRVVVRWFDNGTKRRARWEIKWLRDDIGPGETLNFQSQTSVPRSGKFTVVVSLLRLSGSRFSPPTNDRADMKLPGEFARAAFQTEVRAPAPLAAGLGGAEEPIDNKTQQ